MSAPAVEPEQIWRHREQHHDLRVLRRSVTPEGNEISTVWLVSLLGDDGRAIEQMLLGEDFIRARYALTWSAPTRRPEPVRSHPALEPEYLRDEEGLPIMTWNDYRGLVERARRVNIDSALLGGGFAEEIIHAWRVIAAQAALIAQLFERLGAPEAEKAEEPS
jgi:hypothetical protein